MSKRLLFFMLLALFVLFGSVEALTQDRSYVIVKARDMNNGVIVVDIAREGKAYRLTCNENMPGCSALKNGRYQMVQLPKNFGMYECKDVEIYPEFVINPEKDNKIGEFCLEER